MAYTRITSTRYGKSAVDYAMTEKTDNKNGMARVLMASGNNIDPSRAVEQLQMVWDAYGKADHKTIQMYRVIQSFGLDELDPSNADDVARANEIGHKLANELYPDKQALIITQADGKGGKLHNHVLVNSVGFTDGKSLRGYRKEHSAISAVSDEILESYGMTPLDTVNTRKRRTDQEKRLADDGKYVWKDDLRSRIDSVLADPTVTNREIFLQKLKDDFDVDANYTDGRKNIGYKFADLDDKQRSCRDGRLGTDYGKKALESQFEANAAIHAERVKRAQEEKERRDAEIKAQQEAKELLITQREMALERIKRVTHNTIEPDVELLDKFIDVAAERDGKTYKHGITGEIREYNDYDNWHTTRIAVADERRERNQREIVDNHVDYEFE